MYSTIQFIHTLVWINYFCAVMVYLRVYLIYCRTWFIYTLVHCSYCYCLEYVFIIGLNLKHHNALVWMLFFPGIFEFVVALSTETSKVVLSSTVSTMIFSMAEAVPLTIYGGWIVVSCLPVVYQLFRVHFEVCAMHFFRRSMGSGLHQVLVRHNWGDACQWSTGGDPRQLSHATPQL